MEQAPATIATRQSLVHRHATDGPSMGRDKLRQFSTQTRPISTDHTAATREPANTTTTAASPLAFGDAHALARLDLVFGTHRVIVRLVRPFRHVRR